MRSPSLLKVSLLAALLSACSSDASDAGKSKASSADNDAGGGGGGASSSSGRLSKAAYDELVDLDVLKYKGKAVSTGETTQDGGIVRVTFDPKSGPMCLRDADPIYAAFYLDRGSDKTMILLDGGGACWTGLCAADETADAVLAPIGPANPAPGNYFRDWNVVFAPYCDGSVFSGDNDLTDDKGPRHQHGRQNLAAALDLAVEHFGASKQVLIGGFSAGGYGTIPGMIAVRLVYPDADIFVMDDSGPGVQNLANTEAIDTRIKEWKFDEVIPASCTGCDHGRGQISELFSWMMENDPTIKISVMSYFEDPVIGLGFNGLDGPAYKKLLTEVTGKVQAAHPDRFKRFMVPGASHVLSAGWDTLTGDGVKLSDWVTAMATGDDTVWKDILANGP